MIDKDELEIKWKKPEEVKPWDKNPQQHDMAGLNRSVEKFGVRQPIIVQKDSGRIIAGHGRLKAYKNKGLDEIPVMEWDCTDEEADAYAVADNQLTMSIGWDYDGLSDLLQDDIEEDYFDALGFDEGELSDLLDEGIGIKEDEFEEPEEIETDIERGDIFELGNHRLMCGDATSEDDVERLMDGEEADMVFTDPPWGVDYTGGTKKWDILYNDDKEGQELINFFIDSFSVVKKYHKVGNALYTFFGLMRAMETQFALQKSGYNIISNIIWNKNQAQFGNFRADYKYKHEPMWYCGNETKKPEFYGENNEVSVWNFDRASKNEYHSTQKPIPLVSKAVSNSSQRNDIILDPFGGSGSTLIACEQLNRKCYMMEIDPQYCQVIIDRWEDFTGEEAEKL